VNEPRDHDAHEIIEPPVLRTSAEAYALLSTFDARFDAWRARLQGESPGVPFAWDRLKNALREHYRQVAEEMASEEARVEKPGGSQ
jgi:hypothetical protein